MTVGDVPIKSNHDFKKKRRQILLRILEEREFDVVLIEMYPFGRRAFKFELKPFLNKIRSLPIRPAVLCSVRDVLVKTCDPTKHMGAFPFLHFRIHSFKEKQQQQQQQQQTWQTSWRNILIVFLYTAIRNSFRSPTRSQRMIEFETRSRTRVSLHPRFHLDRRRHFLSILSSSPAEADLREIPIVSLSSVWAR